MSPERLLQGHRAKIIATAVAGAEILGSHGALAQAPTPQPETQTAQVKQTQIIGEFPFNLYASIFLMTPPACVIPPGAEPTPNTIQTAGVSNTALGVEHAAPSIVLAKQTMSDGSTLICTLPNKPIEKPQPTPEPTSQVNHNIREFMQDKEPRKGSLNTGIKLAKQVYKDPDAVASYLDAVGVDPNKDLKNCKNSKMELRDREGYCMSATVGLFYLSKDQSLSPETRQKAWDAACQLYNWEVTSPIFPKGMKEFVDSFLTSVA